MSNAKTATSISLERIGEFIVEYRNSKAWSQAQMAGKLGVSRVTIARWENEEVKPSALALKQLTELMTGDYKFEDKGLKERDRNSKKVDFLHGKDVKQVSPAPYVLNGPKDQNSFHEKLINIQQHKNSSKLDWETYRRRLSLVHSSDGQPTAQALLEASGPSAKSWSSNYGPHGWHRYVGRFPPHLVRALFNYFQATPQDVVCDPFAGSGTTLVEARLLGIPSIGIEICPLSCLISRTKSLFPSVPDGLIKAASDLETFYKMRHGLFIAKHKKKFKHEDVLRREGNNIADFANIERWFTPEALLGASLVTEFAATRKGYEREIILTALSARMRSIGNVDVDVVRAEYSKKPRENVDVLKMVKNQLLKMAEDVEATNSSHQQLLADKKSVNLKQLSVLEANLPKNSISYIITSPPYGVESLSYLRTHLLSYRTLRYFLKADPYEFGSKVIGSEYLDKEIRKVSELPVGKISKTYRNFFAGLDQTEMTKAHKIRVAMMMNFFQDMGEVVEKFNVWLKPGGMIAFVIGNKKIKDKIIPTDIIMSEIFTNKGFELEEVLGHKLKTNNSNSQVPWQDKIIDQEFVMIFKKSV